MTDTTISTTPARAGWRQATRDLLPVPTRPVVWAAAVAVVAAPWVVR